MVHLSKNVQYGIVGALAIYVVFFTRPAPVAVVSLLSNPLAQLAVLGAIVYVGATVSLLIALVAAVAVVLSIPAREYAGKADDKTMSKPADKAAAVLDLPPSSSKAKKEEKKKPLESTSSVEPEPAGDKVAPTKEPANGSEKFTLGGAPF
jgi:hypothetical protein